MAQIKAVIFDMDGLLLDTERAVLATWKSMEKEWGFHDVEKMFPLCIGCNREKTEKIFREWYGEDFPYWEFREAASRRFIETYETDGFHVPVKEGARELLTYLKEKKIPMALASSTREVVVRRQLGMLGLDTYFEAFATGDMVKNSKPDPEIFLLAMKLLSEKYGALEPAECVVFEDSFHGIRAAHAAGMRGIMVPDMLPPDEEMREKAEVVLGSLLEAPEYLFGKEAH